MSHVMQQLRENIVELLSTEVGSGGYLTEMEKRIYGRRFWPMGKVVASEGLVITGAEVATVVSQSPARIERQIPLTVIGKFRGDDANIEDRADSFQLAIEKAVMSDESCGGLAMSTEFQGSQTESDGSGNECLLQRTLVFSVQIDTLSTDPETPLI